MNQFGILFLMLAGPAMALPLACRTERRAARQLGDCRPNSSRFNVLLYGGTGVDARVNERLGATLGVYYGLSLRGFRSEDFEVAEGLTRGQVGGLLRVLSLRAGLVYRVP